MDSTLRTLESAIRNAVASQSFAQAGALIAQYAAAVEESARIVADSPEAAGGLRARVLDLLQWSQTMTLASRESAAVGLARLRSLRVYCDSGRPTPA